MNVHHIHYDTLGCEKPEDVTLLCDDCHLSKHKESKWKKALSNSDKLDFTRSSNRAMQTDYYNIESGTYRDCPSCDEEHQIFYKEYNEGDKRLVMVCHKSKPRTKFLPREENLDIPVL